MGTRRPAAPITTPLRRPQILIHWTGCVTACPLGGQRGRLKGKQPKLNSQQRAHLLQLDWEGKKTPTELAELFGVSRAAIYRELKKAQQAAA